MSESTETATPNTSETVESVEAPEVEGPDWKVEARKWEDRAKANKSAADTAEALRDQLAAAQQELTETSEKLAGYQAQEQHTQWVSEVLAEVELPDDYGAALRGSSKEELLAHAETLKPLIPTSTGTPVPDAGKTPEHTRSETRTAVRGLFRPE